MSAHAVRPSALPVFVHLLQVLGELDAAGRPVACRVDPDPFTSDDYRDRSEAAQACAMCAAIHACGQFAVANNETRHVWAGIDRTSRSKKETNR